MPNPGRAPGSGAPRGPGQGPPASYLHLRFDPEPSVGVRL